MKLQLIEAEWRIYVHMCVSKLTIIGSDNGWACRLDRAKPLSEPMLDYYWLEPWEQISMKF